MPYKHCSAIAVCSLSAFFVVHEIKSADLADSAGFEKLYNSDTIQEPLSNIVHNIRISFENADSVIVGECTRGSIAYSLGTLERSIPEDSRNRRKFIDTLKPFVAKQETFVTLFQGDQRKVLKNALDEWCTFEEETENNSQLRASTTTVDSFAFVGTASSIRPSLVQSIKQCQETLERSHDAPKDQLLAQPVLQPTIVQPTVFVQPIPQPTISTPTVLVHHVGIEPTITTTTVTSVVSPEISVPIWLDTMPEEPEEHDENQRQKYHEQMVEHLNSSLAEHNQKEQILNLVWALDFAQHVFRRTNGNYFSNKSSPTLGISLEKLAARPSIITQELENRLTKQIPIFKIKNTLKDLFKENKLSDPTLCLRGNDDPVVASIRMIAQKEPEQSNPQPTVSTVSTMPPSPLPSSTASTLRTSPMPNGVNTSIPLEPGLVQLTTLQLPATSSAHKPGALGSLYARVAALFSSARTADKTATQPVNPTLNNNVVTPLPLLLQLGDLIRACVNRILWIFWLRQEPA